MATKAGPGQRPETAAALGPAGSHRSTGTTPKAKANQRCYKASKIAIILCAIIIPIVAEFSAMVVIIAAGLILLLESMQQLNKWQENSILYRSTCEGLRNEQHLYNEKPGPTPSSRLTRRTASWPSGSARSAAEHSKWAAVASEKVHDHAGE
jgi:hypothetical protein